MFHILKKIKCFNVTAVVGGSYKRSNIWILRIPLLLPSAFCKLGSPHVKPGGLSSLTSAS